MRLQARNQKDSYFLVIVLILNCMIADRLDAKPVWEKKWIQIETPNFIIASQLNEKKTRKLAEGLENFRKVVAIFTNMGQLEESAVPTYITVFDGKFNKELGFNRDVAGVFIPHFRSNNVVVFSTHALPDLQVIQHEYVHFLVRNHSSLEYPTWYDEGLAEFLATSRVKNGKLSYGGISENRWYWLQQLPWKSYKWLLNVSDTSTLRRNDSIMYYAQAWALMHFMQFGRKDKDFQVQTMSYLLLKKQGVEPVPAFEQAYELTATTLKRKIQRYLTRIKYYKVGFPQAYISTDAKVSPLAPDTVATRIGTLCLINGEYENAGRYFAAALDINPKNTSAIAGMGDVHKFTDEYELAESFFQQAIELEPDNVLNQLDYGEYFYDRAVKEESISHKKEWFDRSRQFFRKSLELDKSNPEALTMYARSYLATGERIDIALDKLHMAHKYLPSNPDIKLSLAETYIMMGFTADAKKLLRTVMAWSHNAASETAAKMLMRIDPAFAELQRSNTVETH